MDDQSQGVSGGQDHSGSTAHSKTSPQGKKCDQIPVVNNLSTYTAQDNEVQVYLSSPANLKVFVKQVKYQNIIKNIQFNKLYYIFRPLQFHRIKTKIQPYHAKEKGYTT